ncbi:PepSY-like domain-containing protein [Hymenobacter metallicola]|uniref:Putative beta-lactamase-inhibitor-like PepSY-like domain-containing protein n=1 Tax=Hymenobacter metallicola TaxID=2563114 RepID=A0A4Z0PY32_9BACT|nr:PepSY-like domain-containing protein [Hymenobacter metallicola]TGE22627.1 hypothetical protein E5K02_23120 [Hymenobacter metallicola]
MKQYLILAAFALALAAPAHAQQLKATQVPATVVAAFKQKFAQVKEVKWEKEGDKYEAGFEQGKVEMSALLSASGELLETESEMAPTQLPAAVQAKLASTYKAYKVTEAAKIVTASTGATSYEAEVMKGGKKRDILFEANGQEITK